MSDPCIPERFHPCEDNTLSHTFNYTAVFLAQLGLSWQQLMLWHANVFQVKMNLLSQNHCLIDAPRLFQRLNINSWQICRNVLAFVVARITVLEIVD